MRCRQHNLYSPSISFLFSICEIFVTYLMLYAHYSPSKRVASYSVRKCTNSTAKTRAPPRPVATSCLINLSRADLACPPWHTTHDTAQCWSRAKGIKSDTAFCSTLNPWTKSATRTIRLLCMASQIRLHACRGLNARCCCPVVALLLCHQKSRQTPYYQYTSQFPQKRAPVRE